ncbi:MAG: CvpA family protein [Dehalococcoidia bacterium]
MTFIDVLLVAGIVAYAAGASHRGVLALALDLVVLVLSFLLALRLYAPAGDLLAAAGLPDPFPAPAGFLAVMVLALMGLGMLAQRVSAEVPRAWHTSGASRLLGVLPAAGYGTLMAAMVLVLVMALPVAPALKADIERSTVGGALVDEAVAVERTLAGIFGDAVRQTLTFLTVPADGRGGESIALRGRPQNPTVDEAAEAQMLVLVNEERTSRGLNALVVDQTLVDVARAHSFDMWARGYFAHVNPDGDDPFDRLDAGGARYRSAGENLALAPTVEQAHRGLMDSPGHRANILEPSYGRVGIGVVDGGAYGLMFTQNFAD